MSAAPKILKEIKEKDVKYVDVRFTDIRGKMQHVTFDIDLVDEEFLTEGTMFDGSSIAGWKAINESDMMLTPDLDSAYHRPLLPADHAVPVLRRAEPGHRRALQPRPPLDGQEGPGLCPVLGHRRHRLSSARKPSSSSSTTCAGTPRRTTPATRYDSIELPVNTGAEYSEGNMGHRPGPRAATSRSTRSTAPRTCAARCWRVMGDLGMQPEKHHHEVAPAQHELGLKFSDLLTMADRLQLYKYVIHNVAAAYGKTATFMAKPMFGDNGSGMHVHQSIWRDGKPLFAGDKYAGLSQMCLWYIGGIIKHAKAINAFANSTTNSYKRLVPGYEAPVKLAYSARNRSASIRIPHVDQPQGQAPGSPLPRSDGQPLPDLRRPADGRPRRHREPDRSGRARRQEPLRPAAAKSAARSPRSAAR